MIVCSRGWSLRSLPKRSFPLLLPIPHKTLLSTHSSIRRLSSLPDTPIFRALKIHDPQSPAIVHSRSQRSFTYGNLLQDVAKAKETLAIVAGGNPLAGERISFLAENSYDYVVTFLSILAHRAVALPISLGFPTSEIKYILENSQSSVLLSTPRFESRAKEVLDGGLCASLSFGIIGKIQSGSTSTEAVRLEESSGEKGGFMLYTSGTTDRPKGVLLSEDVMTAQARSLIDAWSYSPSDRLLHVLPLHHIHGVINGLFAPLLAGSMVEFLYPFNPTAVWSRFIQPMLAGSSEKPITFFTAVPTIYTRLMSTHTELPREVQDVARTAISPDHLRLNISGSAALPTPIKSAWEDLSKGNILLERYGMTEIGMAISCGLDFKSRVNGSVGWPLPSVEVRLVDLDTHEVIGLGDEIDAEGRLREGEIHVKGPTVFSEYWNNEAATSKEFVDDPDGNGKWFKTGDVASRQMVPEAGNNSQPWAKGPMYFIKGRRSVDIIKVGAEKVSALEVERELLSLPQIAEAAVVGLDSEQWGQKVVAIVVLRESQKNTGRGGKSWGVMDMRRALKDRLGAVKLPSEMKLVDVIPRNAMGKINKKTLVKNLYG